MDERDILQTLLKEFHDKLNQLGSLVPRDAAFHDAPNKIKVAIGMRRVGKTYFLYQHILKLLKEGVNKEQILFINFEDDRLLPLSQKKLALLLEAFYTIFPTNHSQKCYLFLDEIQNVPDWALVIRRFHDTKNAEIFLTGSSAKLLSKEIATSLRGRSLAVEIWPYSFTEFLRAKQISVDTQLFGKEAQDLLRQSFLTYLAEGGFPEVTSYSSDARQATLQEYLELVMYRDIIERHSVRNPSVIKYMIMSLMHNAGNPFTIHKLYNDLKSQGFPTGKDSLYDYAEYIEDAYLAFFVNVHGTSLRKIRANPKKIYAIDPGFVRSLVLNYDRDMGRLLENVVFLDLKRRKYGISYYLTSNRNEVDFVIEKPNEPKRCLQVVWDMKNQETFDREHRALEEGMKELRCDGEIITLDSYLKKGIALP